MGVRGLMAWIKDMVSTIIYRRDGPFPKAAGFVRCTQSSLHLSESFSASPNAVDLTFSIACFGVPNPIVR
jgi:hypothetical protein